MAIIMFYADYFSQKLKKRRIRGVIFSLLGMLSFLIMYMWGQKHEPVYEIEMHLTRWMYQCQVVFVFVIMGVFMVSLLNYVRNLEIQISKQAQQDELTGIPNRNGFDAFFEEIPEEKRNQYCVTIFDIDDFKQINDTYGHNCGDYVLRSLAQMVKVDSKDSFVCRWGGEEFVIVSEMSKGLENIKKENDKIREKVSEVELKYDNVDIRQITITMGMAVYEEGIDLEAWIGLADEKLYQGKLKGKNIVVL